MSLIAEIRCDAHGCEERSTNDYACGLLRGWLLVPEWFSDDESRHREWAKHLCPKHVKLALAAVERREEKR